MTAIYLSESASEGFKVWVQRADDAVRERETLALLRENQPISAPVAREGCARCEETLARQRTSLLDRVRALVREDIPQDNIVSAFVRNAESVSAPETMREDFDAVLMVNTYGSDFEYDFLREERNPRECDPCVYCGSGVGCDCDTRDIMTT